MKTNSLQRIKKLVNELPDNDIKFANKYIESRDFDSLDLLVRSAIKNIYKALNSPDYREVIKYKDYVDDLDKMNRLHKLESEVKTYNQMLKVIFGDDDNYEEQDDSYYDLDNISDEDVW